MPHPFRSLVLAGTLVALSAGAVACGSSGGSDASSSTTKAEVTTTTDAVTTTEATTTTEGATTTTGDDGPTTTVAPGGPVDCQALLLEYNEVFDPDDLSDVVAFFRKYEPSMPDDVAAATERLAVAYDEAGDLGHIDLASVDLTADAQTFSDWTNDGCPAG